MDLVKGLEDQQLYQGNLANVSDVAKAANTPPF
jgi:hypothetical protein